MYGPRCGLVLGPGRGRARHGRGGLGLWRPSGSRPAQWRRGTGKAGLGSGPSRSVRRACGRWRRWPGYGSARARPSDAGSRRPVAGRPGGLWDRSRLDRTPAAAPRPLPWSAEHGFRRILATDSEHPYMGPCWPQGHVSGWKYSFTHQVRDFLTAIRDGEQPRPSFEEGLQVQRVLATIERSPAAQSITLQL
jgi:hypothetical protein